MLDVGTWGAELGKADHGTTNMLCNPVSPHEVGCLRVGASSCRIFWVATFWEDVIRVFVGPHN